MSLNFKNFLATSTTVLALSNTKTGSIVLYISRVYLTRPIRPPQGVCAPVAYEIKYFNSRAFEVLVDGRAWPQWQHPFVSEVPLGVTILAWCFNEQGGDLADTACSDGSSCYPSSTIQL